ncbi:MAG: amidohydrolase family protein [Nocardioidaceae bacterium]
MAFGTDWYVAPLNPLFGIYAAATRRTLDGKNPNGWIPRTKNLGLKKLLRLIRLVLAYAEFQENVKGTITAWQTRGFCSFVRTIFLLINPNNIRSTQILMTVVDGKIVHE